MQLDTKTVATLQGTHVIENIFGQPLGGIVQVAYVVEDLQKSIAEFSQKFNIGPWFYSNGYTLKEASYRGKPTDMRMGLALSFSGNMCFEVIQPLDDKPSVYWDVIKKKGYGFHHLGMATTQYEVDVARYQKMGYVLAFEGLTPRGIRFAYFDTTGDLPGMLELIEYNDTQLKFLSLMQQASVNWDGKDPSRKIEIITNQLT
jgi:hypothetical protein